MFSKIKLIFILVIAFLNIAACTFSGVSKKRQDNSALGFITGAAELDKTNDVHIINLIRAIGAPTNNVAVDKYKYYNWQHSKTLGVSTLFGGGSTTLYCNLTAETQNNKIKLINWYGNNCGIFLTPISDYFKDKLNIYVLTDEEEKKPESVKSSTKTESDQEQKNNLENKPMIDLRQKNSESKLEKTEQKISDIKQSEQNFIETKSTETAVGGK